MTKILNFKHSGNSGDIIYALSSMKAAYEKYQTKVNLYLWLERPAFYYSGAVHPVYDATGKNNVMLNHYMFNMLKPLLEAQPYIESVKPWQGEEIDVDMDSIRQVNIGIPNGHIGRWYFYKFHDLNTDLSVPAIKLPKPKRLFQSSEYGKYILVNRTERYTNVVINYAFLRKYPKVLFTGTKREFELFSAQVPKAFFLLSENFLELAHWIKDAQLFIGNQSMCYGIAEQMKTKRVLELCSYAPNVIPCGKDGFDFYTQDALEYYVDKLWKGQTP